MLGALGSQPALVIAQDEEVISDPELSGGGGGARGDSSGDEVIEDPELSGGGARKPRDQKKDYGWGEVYEPPSGEGREEEEQEAQPAEPPEEPDPMANTGIPKLEISGQTAIDTNAESNLEDFYEARLRFGGEVDFRISRRLRLSIGTRIDYSWYAPFQNDSSLTTPVVDPMGNAVIDTATGEQQVIRRTLLQEDRHELDIVPLAAYVDATVTDGVHLRVGHQVVSLARMDGISVTDMLVVLDFRPSTKADPAGMKLAQPAVRLDWDFNSWATLQLVYVPWFMPHLMRANRDNYVGQAIGAVGNSSLPPTGVSAVIDPSYQARAQEDVVRFVGPAPDFSTPQAEARLNFRGNSFELALLGGTAIEKLPSIYYTPLVNSLATASLKTPENRVGYFEQAARAGFLAANGHSLFDAEYHRYYMAGVDGSFDIAPIQVNFEFAYSPSRHLYTFDGSGSTLPMSDVSKRIADGDEIGWVDSNPADDIEVRCVSPMMACATDRSVRKGVQMVQAALHIEYLKEETLLLAAEGYLFQALGLPHAQNRHWLFFPKDKGTFLAGLLMANYNLQEGKYSFSLTGMVTSGPSYIVMPQIEFRVTDGFYLNIGAQFYEGPTPNNLTGGPRRVATNLTPAGIFSGYDNVYLGFRWSP